ncbi:universal stress protein [Sediminibacterium soli]|uniref:universal stress protein n=1 Tax=Sediminibacterium soli TaxID=2698829 RepID=UPI001379F78C|nr:universal stress protein [Sediminibacterium soli]NCI46803.1 universal stress protein [Sediminibacterium soli]
MKKILAPVDTDSRSLAVARQVAELAREYDAELVLLHIADIRERPNRFLSFFTGKGAEAFDRLTKEKSELLHTWKRSLEKDYGIRVQVQVHWDQRKKGILKYADSLEVDMIALKATNFAARNVFGKQCLEYLIEESHCQVVSFLSDTTSIGQWKQVVMPVTDFVPETRIRTIAEIARSFRLKVHLIAVPAQHSNPDQDFYFLTETLKRLKPLGNIQVECRCLKQNGNHTHSFLRYAKEVGADIILTNRLFSFDYQGVSRHNRFLFDYV